MVKPNFEQRKVRKRPVIGGSTKVRHVRESSPSFVLSAILRRIFVATASHSSALEYETIE